MTQQHPWLVTKGLLISQHDLSLRFLRPTHSTGWQPSMKHGTEIGLLYIFPCSTYFQVVIYAWKARPFTANDMTCLFGTPSIVNDWELPVQETDGRPWGFKRGLCGQWFGCTANCRWGLKVGLGMQPIANQALVHDWSHHWSVRFFQMWISVDCDQMTLWCGETTPWPWGLETYMILQWFHGWPQSFWFL